LTRLRNDPETTHQRRAPTPANNPVAPEDVWARNIHSILSAERERLQQLFQQAPGFICVLHGPHHVYEFANTAYYQLIGHRDILGHALADVLPEIIVQGYLEKLDRVFATGTPFIGRALPIELQRIANGPLEQRYIDIIYQPVL